MGHSTSASERRWTYSSTRTGLLERAMEAYYLLAASGKTAEAVRATVDNVATMRRRVRQAFGVELRGLRMLDVGPGQQLRHMRCFSTDNEVVGIDTDVILEDLNLSGCVQMVRCNSLTRVAKTMARKVIGVDRDFASTLAKDLGRDGFGRQDVRRMDAAEMTFPSGDFDFVYTHSAFEHIERPLAALYEVRRVLAPGGIAYVSLHLYTSHSGQHDPKMLVQSTPEPPLWPHLRPRYQDTVSPSAYLNEVRLAEWKRLFERVMPGVLFAYERHDELIEPLARLRAAGELRDYDDDELLTINLVALWRRPPAAQC